MCKSRVLHNPAVTLSNKTSRHISGVSGNIMAVFRKDLLLCLALMVSSAEATHFSDPVICYVLDAVLLFYCIIFTALYFKLKFAKTFAQESTSSDPAEKPEGIYEQPLKPAEDHYEDVRRKTRAPSDGDPQRTTQPRKKANKAKRPKSKSNAAEAIEMSPASTFPAHE